MTYSTYYSYKWCDSYGTWHSGYPASGCDYTKIYGCNWYGSWSDCTPDGCGKTYCSYKWCDTNGTWHSGYPTDYSNCTQLQGCDYWGNWTSCTVPKDGIVEGTSGSDLIDYNYTGDPEGDKIDHNDQIIAGEGVNDDIVKAGAGNDTVKAGTGHDDVYGGTGDDTLHGEAGNDILRGEDGNDKIYGGAGDDSVLGGAGNDHIEGDGGAAAADKNLVVDWQNFSDNCGSINTGSSYDMGGVKVTFGFTAQDSGAAATTVGDYQYVASGDGLNGCGGVKLSGCGGEGGTDNTSTTTLTFASTNTNYASAVSNVSFRLNDIDIGTSGDFHIDIVTVRAYDANGNLLAVTYTPAGAQTVSGGTVTGTSVDNGTISPTTQLGSVLVSISGTVARIEIDYDNGGPTDQAIWVTDINCTTVTSGTGVDGNDTLDGGDGDDVILGQGGNDSIIGGTGKDSIDGGTGNDNITGNAGDDIVRGGAGDDFIDDAVGGDQGTGNDSFYGEAGNDTLWGGLNNDALFGGDGNDRVSGEEGNDLIDGGAGNDILSGGNDRDVLKGGIGDTADGGAGGDDYDVLDLTGQGKFILTNVTPDSNGNGTNGTVVFVDANGVPTGQTMTFAEIESIVGDRFNQGPVATDDTASVPEDGSVTINVLGNDTDPEGNPLTVTGASSPNGTVVVNPNGTVTFTPNANYTGPATITYTISDGQGGTDTGAVNVTVTPVNDGPDAVDGAATTAEDTAVTVNLLANDTDPEGNPLTVTSATVPASQGTLVNNGDGTVTFTPAANFTGTATISYTITDGQGGTDSAIHTVSVTPVNDGPVAVDDTATVPEDGSVTINVLGNDTDPDGNPLTVTGASSPNGTVVVNPNGTVTFTPNANYTGPATITYTIADGQGGTDTGAVNVTVTPVNDGPDAVDDGDSTGFNTPVTVDLLANDTDVDGDTLTVSSATVPAAQGTLVNNGDGTVTFAPATGFIGTATITYSITDGQGGTDTAIHSIVVNAGLLDGTVEGTDGNDLINDDYLGDPEGDRVDNLDAILPGDTGNDDLIYGYGGNDRIDAGDGHDEIYGGDGNDIILARDGNDTIYGDAGDDRLTGGEGNDTIYGGTGSDTIVGDGGEDLLEGGAGNDSITGGDQNDVIIGGTGSDTLSGFSGDDSITGGTGNDVVDGGSGNDVINTTGPNSSQLPDIGYPGFYPADPIPTDDLDTVYGGNGDDTITTGDDDDDIYGGIGNDTIDAGIDDDYVEGGAGNDKIIGSEGGDEIYGGLGDDLIIGGIETDILDLPDDIDGNGDSNGPGEDLVTFNNKDTLFGGDGNDTIFGNDDDDTLFGGTGDDVLDGGIDDDTLIGDEGNDDLTGGQGNDTLQGGDGADTLTGGIGNDVQSGGFGSDRFIGGNAGDTVTGGEDADGSDVDVLDLTGSGVDHIEYVSGDPEAGTVFFADGSTMTFSEIERVIPCFTPGTTIATPKGERLVEELQVGDRIITRDNGIQEIAWVGQKHMTGKTLVGAPHLRPILIKAGALGNNLPERDMLVSPNHRVLVASDLTQLYFEEREVLAAAKHLVGSAGIHQVDVMQTTYVHFMFEQHEVVLSNGSWTESFQPGDYSLKGVGNSQRNEIIELFPELATKAGLEDYQSARKSLKKHEARLLVK